jgi:hypothetical protein
MTRYYLLAALGYGAGMALSCAGELGVALFVLGSSAPVAMILFWAERRQRYSAA